MLRGRVCLLVVGVVWGVLAMVREVMAWRRRAIRGAIRVEQLWSPKRGVLALMWGASSPLVRWTPPLRSLVCILRGLEHNSATTGNPILALLADLA